MDLSNNQPSALKMSAAIESAWKESVEGEHQLNAALETFDWTAADRMVSDLIAALSSNPGRFDEPFARRVLSALQRKRRFSSMIRVGDALIQQGFTSSAIRRPYAHALIDQGYFCP